MSTFIGVAKGELGKFVEVYFKSLGVELDIEGPLTQVKDLPGGKLTFRIQRSRDVPRWIGSGYDFGITGNDVLWDEVLLAGESFAGWYTHLAREAKRLGFENLFGQLALLGNENYKEKKDRLVVAVSDYYPNIARFNLQKKDELKPSDYEMKVVQGSVEGYLSGGDADLAVDTIFSRDTLDKENEELRKSGKPGIVTVRKIMDTYPAAIFPPRTYFNEFGDLFLYMQRK